MDYTILLRAPLFKGLTLDQIVTTIYEVSGRVRKFSEGTMIALSGEKVNSLMLVLSGQVKGEMVDYSGKIIKIEDIFPPGALASAFIFGGRNFFPVNVVSVSDTQLLFIGKSEFLNLLKKNEMILINFLDLISNRSQFLSEKIKFLNFKTIKGKLAQFILQKAGNDKSEITLELTQNDLAEFFGVARPSIARAIGELEEGGYILSKGKHVRILDKNGLSGLRFE